MVALVLLLIPNRNKRELLGGQEAQGRLAPKEGQGKEAAGGKDKAEEKEEETEQKDKDGAK